MKKHLFLSVVVLFALVLVSCGPRVTDVAVIKSGQTIKIGMGSPMTGGDSADRKSVG